MAAVPDAVVGSLLENLKDFVVSDAYFIPGAKANANANANELCDQLEVLKGFVTKQRYSDDDFLSGLPKKVRRLVFKAEDTIETYIGSVSSPKFTTRLPLSINVIGLALKFRNIKKELAALTQEVQSFCQQEPDKRLNDMQEVDKDKAKAKDDEGSAKLKKHLVDDDMVGRKDVMLDILEYLKDGPDDLQTVSIVGMGGLGKTTLAIQVFKHPIVEFQFTVRAFVRVSQEFKRKEVLSKLVCAFGNVSVEEIYNMDEDQLEKTIQNYLEKRNYLIVLDDVWTTDTWDYLQSCFPDNQKHSRVLITTRHMPVAKHAKQGFTVKPYILRFLNAQESRDLLRKRIFGKTDAIKADLEVHETAILDRCSGLPLAIVVIAGILTNHWEESYRWEDVSRKVETYNLAMEADCAIQLSFNHLPYHLKPCYLYLGVFPEDFEIPSKMLYQLWVSEGFVSPGDVGVTFEDKAESYLEQLVDRSLVMVDKRRLNGRIKTIRIHDTLREFCKTRAVVEELFREIKFGDESREMSADDDRRLCINSKVKEYLTISYSQAGKFVRSFLSFAKEDYLLPLEYSSGIPRAFGLLRVLDVRSIMFTQFPSELYYTFLLKYIAVRGNLKTIPRRVSNLRYLQTLIFNTTFRNLEIRADIWKMKQLRHLQTNASTSLQKSKAFNINANLQTLTAISPESCTPELFIGAPRLKKLGISGELDPFMETLFFRLPELGCLENLKLLNVNTTVPLKCLPSGNSFPLRLTRLTLQNTMLGWEWMSTLAKLEKLEVLKLKENAFLGEIWNAESTGCFSTLKVLHIGETDLVTWKASENHFPQLTHLYLRYCTRLGNIPSNLVNISTLKLIDIYCCKLEVVNSARKIVLTKLKLQAKEKNGKSNPLELSVYPPED